MLLKHHDHCYLLYILTTWLWITCILLL